MHFSTTAVFDPDEYMKNGGIFNEVDKILPKTIYGATKYASELAVKQSVKKYVILKPVFIYGDAPYDNSSNLNKLLKAIVFNKRIGDITLSNEFKKNYMYIDYFALMMKQIIDNVDLCLNEDFIISRDPDYAKRFNYWLDDLAKVIDEPDFNNWNGYMEQKPEKDYLKHHLGVSFNFYKKFPNFKLPKEAYDDMYNLRKVLSSIIKIYKNA